MASRLSYEESCRRLQPEILDEGAVPPMPAGVPRHDDATPGVSIFRMLLGADVDFSNLTLPRTFCGRCEIKGASFKNTDLTESSLCWNDFVNVDFSGAVLAGADLRASNFEKVNFSGANLRNADMRGSSFTDCSFERAVLDGVLLTKAQGKKITLSQAQRSAVAWTDDKGPEPEGG